MDDFKLSSNYFKAQFKTFDLLVDKIAHSWMMGCKMEIVMIVDGNENTEIFVFPTIIRWLPPQPFGIFDES